MLFDQALTDTPPEVEQIQIDLLRQAGQARAPSSCCPCRKVCLRFPGTICKKCPPICQKQSKKVKFVELLYGPALANAFQQFLQQLENGP
jgi:hypothetical protein